MGERTCQKDENPGGAESWSRQAPTASRAEPEYPPTELESDPTLCYRLFADTSEFKVRQTTIAGFTQNVLESHVGQLQTSHHGGPDDGFPVLHAPVQKQEFTWQPLPALTRTICIEVNSATPVRITAVVTTTIETLASLRLRVCKFKLDLLPLILSLHPFGWRAYTPGNFSMPRS